MSAFADDLTIDFNTMQTTNFKPITDETVVRSIPVRRRDGYKGDYGRVLCIGGFVEMAGAITLAGKAALYSGAGLVTIATDPANFSSIHSQCLEIMCTDYHHLETLTNHLLASDTILIGPGLGRDDWASELFEFVLDKIQSHQQLIIDADGSYHLSHMKVDSLPAETIITPHLGEWERLTGLKPSKQSPALNQHIQRQLNAIVVLKMDRTEVYTSTDSFKNTTGNPGMAVGGMGDTLAGMITGFIKQFDTPIDAVTAAVYLHSYIGDNLAQTHYIALPSRIIDEIPKTMKHFLNQK